MRFRSNSDSEVVLHGYLLWGLERLLESLDGMYALAIADLAAGRLHLARDRAGVKPLLHSSRPGLFAWTSEPSALLRLHQDDPPELDGMLYDFLTYRYIPAPRTAGAAY